MKHIIFTTTFFLLISCGKGSGMKTIDNSNDRDKNCLGQTDATDQSTRTTETKNGQHNLPVDIALKFINSYVDNCNKMKEAVCIIDWVNSSDLTTNHFKIGVKSIIEEAYKEDTELGLGFDPIFDAQDYDDKGFELATFDSKTNFIEVKGKNLTNFKLTIKMVLENNKWLVEGCGIINIPKDKQSHR